jgi:hypothetical protein
MPTKIAKIKILHCKIGQPPAVVEISQTLQALQQLVGGYIEFLPIKRKGPRTLSFLLNEEGTMAGLPLNTLAFAERPLDPEGFVMIELQRGLAQPGQPGVRRLLGDIAVVAASGTHNVSLTDEEVKTYVPLLSRFVGWEGQSIRLFDMEDA